MPFRIGCRGMARRSISSLQTSCLIFDTITRRALHPCRDALARLRRRSFYFSLQFRWDAHAQIDAEFFVSFFRPCHGIQKPCVVRLRGIH